MANYQAKETCILSKRDLCPTWKLAISKQGACPGISYSAVYPKDPML